MMLSLVSASDAHPNTGSSAPYRLEIADALAMIEAAEGFRDLFNDIRPHESFGFLTPLEVDCSGYNYSRPRVSRKLDSGHTCAHFLSQSVRRNGGKLPRLSASLEVYR